MNKSTFKISKTTLVFSGLNYENLEFNQLLEDHLIFKLIIVKDRMSENLYLMKSIDPTSKYPEEKIRKELEILEKIRYRPGIPIIFFKYCGYFKSENMISGSVEYNFIFEYVQSTSLSKSMANHFKFEPKKLIEFYNKTVNALAYLQSIDVFLPEINAEMFYIQKNQENDVDFKFMISFEDFEPNLNPEQNLKMGVFSFGVLLRKLISESLEEEKNENEGDGKMNENIKKFEKKFLGQGSDIMQRIESMMVEEQEKRPDYLKLFKKKMDLKKNLMELIKLEESSFIQKQGITFFLINFNFWHKITKKNMN